MEMQFRYVSKEELYKMIDEIPADKLMVLTYKKNTGISDNGKMIKKNKTKVLADKATIIVMTETNPIRKIDLEGEFCRIPFINNNVIKSILLPQLE